MSVSASTRMHRPTFSVSATHSAWTACFDGLGTCPNARIICGDGNRKICRLIWFAAIGVLPQLSRAQIGKTLLRCPRLRGAPALRYFGRPSSLFVDLLPDLPHNARY